MEKEFDRQVENLLHKGYPETTGLTKEEFLKYVLPLKEKVVGEKLPEANLEKGILPFVIVVTSELIPADQMMAKVERDGKPGITKLFPHEPTDFAPIESVQVPKTPVYLLIDIDRGKEFLNIRPEDAFKTIQKAGRSPLTIDEGISIVTQFPDFLIKNNCFSLLASRHTGDQRVPAIWINSHKQPNLGWCWDRNPHTWLGSASCAKRM
jgi:hypothetical protein